MVALFSVTSLWGQGFHITMQIDNMPDCNVMVAERIPNPTEFCIDTLAYRNGKVEYRASVDYPRMVNFIFCNEGDDFYGSFSMFLDNSKEIKISGKSLKEIRIEGCKSHDEYQKISDEGKELFAANRRLGYEKSKAFGQKEKYDSLNILSQQVYNQLFDYILGQPGYANSLVVPYFIYDLYIGNTEKLEKALAGFSPSLDTNAYVKSCKEELERQKKSAIGKPAYDFCLKDVEGNTYRLSDYKGKYVLVEFSASWCGWCKKEIPYLKRVFEQHKGDERFAMFTINLDKKRDLWERDVKEFNLPWKVISDLQAFDGPVTDAYNVHGIPMIFLVSPDGKIIEKNLRGEEMIETVNKYLPKATSQKFRIQGEMKGLPEGLVRLYSMSNLLLDRCYVKDGKYELKGNLEKAQQCYLFFEMKPAYQKPFASFVRFYLQPLEMQIYSELEDVPHTLKFTNAPIQNELSELSAKLGEYADYKVAQKLNYEIQEAYKNSDMPKVRDLNNKRMNSIKSLFNQFFKDDSSRRKSEAAAYLAWEQVQSFPADEQEKVIGWFDSSLSNTFYLASIRDFSAQEKGLKIGMALPNFVAQNEVGTEVSLKDFAGKYLFLEFSASWCGWCKKEIPFIRKAYHAMKDKNVAFVTLMMDDKKEAWLDEIKKFNIEWLTLSDLKGMKKSPITKAYNLNGVPASFLVSPEGKILARDLRGDEVLSTIQRFVEGKSEEVSGISFQEMSWADALAEANKNERLIFVDCYTSWCGPCKKMAKDVFTNAEVGDYFNAHFLNLKIDMEKGEGPALAKKYQVKAYPTFLFINGKGELVHQMAGAMSAGDFLEQVKSNMNGETLEVLEQKFQSGNRSLKTVKAYLAALAGAMRYDDVKKVWNTYWEGLSDEEKTTKEVWPLVKRYTGNVRSQSFDDLITHKNKYIAQVGEEAYAGKVHELVYATVVNTCNDMIYNNGPVELDKIDFLDTVVAKAQCDTTGMMKNTLAMTRYAAKKEIGKAIKVYQKGVDGYNDSERFTATLQMNAIVYKAGKKADCKKTYEVFQKVADRYQWDKSSPMMASIFDGLKEKME